jgi:Domain of unknown function (DUF4190)/GYF domain 2
MDEHFYIRIKGRVQGPFTAGELRERAGRQQFSRLYEISTDGDTWSRATSRPDLFPAAALPELSPEPLIVEVEPEELEPEPEPARSIDPEPAETQPFNLWFYTQNSQEFGPTDFEHLANLVRSGQVGTQEFAWTDGMNDWATISEIPGLATLMRSGASAQRSPTASPAESSRGDHAAVAPTTSSLAVASLVLGLLGWNLLFMVGSILAIVFGHSALRDIRDSNGRIGGAGMATAGLVLGYIVLIGTLVTLFGLLFLVLLAGARLQA